MHPEKYGFQIPEEQLYDQYKFDVVTVSQPIYNLAEFAEQHGTSYRMLKVMNPWLIGTTLKSAGNKTYEIRIAK